MAFGQRDIFEWWAEKWKVNLERRQSAFSTRRTSIELDLKGCDIISYNDAADMYEAFGLALEQWRKWLETPESVGH